MHDRKEQATTAPAEGHRPIDWGYAYELYGADLFAFLRRALGDRVEAEDLMQEVFMRAMRARSHPEPDALRPWLFRIASNLAISHHRRRRILTFLSLKSSDAIEERPDDDEGRHVRAALRSIPRDQAVTLTLALHEGFSRREIAQMLGLSEEAVKSRLARGRRNFAVAYRTLGL
jgi:RNA polymerase sigma-70 factor (ECF subfamily)